MTSHETSLNLSGRKVSRAARAEALIADLRDLDSARRQEIRTETLETIEYLHQCHRTQRSNGMAVTEETLRKNLARHLLMLECLDAVS